MTMNVHELADRIEIQDTITRYSTALDVPGRRWDEWDRCFAPDAIIEDLAGPGSRMGRDEMREFFSKNDAVRLTTQHLLANFVISVDGDTATARTEGSYASLNRTDTPGRARLNRSGYWYEDHLVRLDEGWRIKWRKFHSRWRTAEEIDWAY